MEIADDQVRIGEHFRLSLQRTLRIPEDARTYPLPPGLGRVPLVPGRAPGELVAPLYQGEAVWLAFGGAAWRPNAVQVAAGGVNAVSGEPWEAGLAAAPQNYLVCPDQPWLDGINTGAGSVRQFVAMPLGSGRTIEGQLTGRESVGGIQVRVFEPHPGRFPDEPPPVAARDMPMRSPSPHMGLGAGGRIRQKLYPDPYGFDAWDPDRVAGLTVRLLNSVQWHELTGHPAPPSPVSAELYARHGLPWFELYDEERADLAPSGRFAGLEGTADAPGATIDIAPDRVRGIDRRRR